MGLSPRLSYFSPVGGEEGAPPRYLTRDFEIRRHRLEVARECIASSTSGFGSKVPCPEPSPFLIVREARDRLCVAQYVGAECPRATGYGVRPDFSCRPRLSLARHGDSPLPGGERCSTRRRLVMEEMLGFCVLVLTMVGLVGVAVWLCCSIAEDITRTRRRLKDSRYDALSRENKRLKGFLAEAEEENSRLREIYYSERIRHKTEAGRNAA